MNSSERQAARCKRFGVYLILLLAVTRLPLVSVWADDAPQKDDSAPIVVPPPPPPLPPPPPPPPAPTPAKDDDETVSPQLEVVDIPTADVLDPKTFSTSFRFYNQGGITSRLVLGPFKRLNIGFSEDAQHLIGSDNPHAIRPSAFIKFRFFDGTDVIPAFAIGYDNQGYLYQESTKDFLQKEKGLYLVGSHEIFLPDFELHAGVNIPRVDEDGTPFGFFGVSWKIVPTFALLAEYDNIQNAPDNRVNLGGRFWVTPYFNIDVAARNVGRGSDRGAERIVRLNYVTNFPF